MNYNKQEWIAKILWTILAVIAGLLFVLAGLAGGQSDPAPVAELCETWREIEMKNLKAIQKVLWITMGLNLIATAAKLIVGYQTGALSLIADGYDSVFDSVANVVGLVGIYLASRPADEDHPYGHRKAETMTALIISSLLFLTTWELVESAIERLRNPSLIQTEVNAWSFVRAGRRLHSDVLVADAMHTRADVFVSLSVVGGLIAVRIGYPLVDPILALVIALVIAKIGIDIIRESSPTLMDRTAVPPNQVKDVALSVPGVLACHQVRSRGHETAVYLDLHIQVEPTDSVEQAHGIAHEVKRQLQEQFPHVEDATIHIEPVVGNPQAPHQEQATAQAQ
jgi:cation diffusion facilitator family transporter